MILIQTPNIDYPIIVINIQKLAYYSTNKFSSASLPDIPLIMFIRYQLNNQSNCNLTMNHGVELRRSKLSPHQLSECFYPSPQFRIIFIEPRAPELKFIYLRILPHHANEY